MKGTAKEYHHPLYVYKTCPKLMSTQPDKDYQWEDKWRSNQYKNWGAAAFHAQDKGFRLLQPHETVQRGDVALNKFNNLELIEKRVGHLAGSVPCPVYTSLTPKDQQKGFNWNKQNMQCSDWHLEAAIARNTGYRLMHPEEKLGTQQIFILEVPAKGPAKLKRVFLTDSLRAKALYYPVYVQCEMDLNAPAVVLWDSDAPAIGKVWAIASMETGKWLLAAHHLKLI